MPVNQAWRLRFALGVILIALGAYVAAYPLWNHRRSITGTRWLDVTFAFVFLVRGLINVRTARRRRTQSGAA